MASRATRFALVFGMAFATALTILAITTWARNTGFPERVDCTDCAEATDLPVSTADCVLKLQPAASGPPRSDGRGVERGNLRRPL
jgi:hypothetical protein